MNDKELTRFMERMRKTLVDHRMLTMGDHVLVAVSGGPDSTALLTGLVALAPEMRLTLGVFHLNHGLRPEAGEDAAHVRSLAARYGLPCHDSKADVGRASRESGEGIQAAARRIRYARMEAVAAEYGFDKLAVGHTADDVAETFLMRLVRGSGPAGLGSIPPVRDGRIIRPLIGVRRHDILAYLDAAGLDFLDDPSNADRKYFRNRIRHDLLPRLAEYNPRVVERLVNTAKLLREDEQYIECSVEAAYSRTARVQPQEVSFDITELGGLDPVIWLRVIRRAVMAVGAPPEVLGSDHIRTVWNDLVGRDERAHSLPGEIQTRREDGRLVVYRAHPPLIETRVEPGQTVSVSGRRCLLEVKPMRDVGVVDEGGRFHVGIEAGNEGDDIVWADAGGIDWPVTVRSARAGDDFRPLGLGGRKKVHDFFIDNKVPRRLRPTVPIYVDSLGVIAVGGRVDERVRITEKTERVAVIAMMGETAGQS